MDANPTYTVIAQAWEESERDWGVRSDGASLHKTLEDCAAFRHEFWAKEREDNPSGIAPDYYSRESGKPHEIEIGEELYEHLAASKNGIWISDATYNALRRVPR